MPVLSMNTTSLLPKAAKLILRKLGPVHNRLQERRGSEQCGSMLPFLVRESAPKWLKFQVSQSVVKITMESNFNAWGK